MPAALVLAAVLSAAASEVTSGCSPAQRAAVVAGADLRELGRDGGRRIVLAALHGDCVCGNVNCPYLVLRVGGDGRATVLLSTDAYEVDPVRTAAPLPNLREVAHDSALVSVETTDAWARGTYTVAATARVRGDTGARKPDAVPVHFAPGTSAATLRGSVALGWYDEYALVARRGQTLTIAGVRSPAPLTFTAFPSRNAAPLNLRPGVPARLPSGGTVLLHVEGDGEAEQPYQAQVTIR